VLNHCTKYLARDEQAPRHDFLGAFGDTPRAAVADCWRFPVIDASAKGADWNDVTFVYRPPDSSPAGDIRLVSTIDRLHDPVPLSRVGSTPFFACSLVVRKMRRCRYAFLVDGTPRLDPINPQTETLATGEVWSSFFTWAYNQPITFERWEFVVLDRLTRHILPFSTPDAQNYLKRHASDPTAGHLYRLDVSVGVANFIDKLVAREERHHRYAYKTCLEMLHRVLRRRHPARDPGYLEESAFTRLYGELAHAAPALFADGWEWSRYNSPPHFLWLLRRHAWTGAFAHPRWGGNPGGLAWRYLAERFRTDDGTTTAFAWQRAIEPPLGTSPDYRG
jgi:hypothetical protein